MDLFVFDIDDTISLTAKLHQDLFTKAINNLGIHEFDADFASYLHHTDRYIANQVCLNHRGTEMSSEEVLAFEEFILSGLKDYAIREIKGARNFIEEAENIGIAVCYATGAMQKTGAYKLACLNIPFNNALLVGSNQLESREEIVSTSIAQAKKHYQQQEFNRILSFGDGLWDLNTALNLKLEFVGIGERNRDSLCANGASDIYTDYSKFSFKKHGFST